MDIRETVTTWTIKEFAQRLKETLAGSLPGCSLEVRETRKNNGVMLTGIAVREHGSNAAAVYYLEGLYARCMDGEPMGSLRDAFLDACKDSGFPEGDDTAKLLDFAAVRDRVCLRLVNAAANRESLETLPHRLFHDLAVTYYVSLWGGSVTVTEDLLRQWGTDEGELYALALGNTREILRLSVVPLSQAICRVLGETGDGGPDMLPDLDFLDLPLYSAGAASGIDGACIILYNDILEGFSQQVEADFYILPSSRHETLFLPAGPQNCPCDAGSLREMVRGINRTQVAAVDFLSDNVYIYHQQEKRLEMLAD